MEKMYDFALRNRMTFYLSPSTLDDGITRGRLVPLTGDSTYEMTRGVGFSYSTREAKGFVTAFAPQYLYACGAPLTVTSAARPISRQPHNSNPHSVHPTGIAVDLRRPAAGPCLTWVRGALATLESRGVIEVTEERHPVHLHIAVLVPPGQSVRLPSLIDGVKQAPRIAQPDDSLAIERLASPEGASNTFRFASLTPMHLFASRQDAAAAMTARTLLVPDVLPPRLETVSAGEVSAATGSAASRPTVYRVRQGDTLWDVANKLGVTVPALARTNGLRTTRALRPGTTLRAR
ncbi:MAG: LysM peptidoglycan-binding domain-containing protein [Gemmatimonadaceae bacterium]|nr:LysM peptidoglycan-binding domain-containing protein [Gemmatimonadaceae bacterium]